MSIFRMLGYGLLGYTLYQLTYGLRNEMMARQGEADGGEGEQSRPQGSSRQSFGGGSNITGPGRGKRVSTMDSTGESVSHNVGRGVVS